MTNKTIKENPLLGKDFNLTNIDIFDTIDLIQPMSNMVNPIINPIRVENDFTRFAYLFHQFGVDGKLMFEVISFLIYKFQYDVNLFSNEHVREESGWLMVFEVTEFAKIYKYRKENLMRSHKDPSYLKYNSNKDLSNKSFFTTTIGNAIYRLYREKLDLSKKIGLSSKNESIELIKHINNPDESRGLRGKYIVEVLLEREFIDNINKKFVLVSNPMLVELNKGKKNLSIPYVHFSFRSNYLTNIKQNKWDYQFDEMCDILNIDIQTPADAKKKIKMKIKLLNELSDLELRLEFYKQTPGSRWEYGVRIHYLNNGINDTFEPFRKLAVRDAVILSFVINLTPFYKQKYHYKYHNNTDFLGWLGNQKKEHEEKVRIFISTFQNIIGTNPSSSLIDKVFKDPKAYITDSTHVIPRGLNESNNPTKN